MCVPGPGGAGGEAQGRGPGAGLVGYRELPGRLSWHKAEGLQPFPPWTSVCCQDLWGPTRPAQRQGSMCLGYRRLDAELSVAALLSLHMVPPPPATHTLAERLWAGTEAREGGNSPTVLQPAGGFLGQRGDTGPKDRPRPGSCHKGHLWSGWCTVPAPLSARLPSFHAISKERPRGVKTLPCPCPREGSRAGKGTPTTGDTW